MDGGEDAASCPGLTSLGAYHLGESGGRRHEGKGSCRVDFQQRRHGCHNGSPDRASRRKKNGRRKESGPEKGGRITR